MPFLVRKLWTNQLVWPLRLVLSHIHVMFFPVHVSTGYVSM